MGHTDDNLEIIFHRQKDWVEPEISIRHHHGIKGIDRKVAVKLEVMIDLVHLSDEPVAFRDAFAAAFPRFFADLPPSAVSTLRLLFPDLRIICPNL